MLQTKVQIKDDMVIISKKEYEQLLKLAKLDFSDIPEESLDEYEDPKGVIDDYYQAKKDEVEGKLLNSLD